MTQEQMAQCLNEWMRRYTEDPEGFEREARTVARFLRESAEGVEPSYGQVCAAYMMKIAADLNLL